MSFAGTTFFFFVDNAGIKQTIFNTVERELNEIGIDREPEGNDIR